MKRSKLSSSLIKTQKKHENNKNKRKRHFSDDADLMTQSKKRRHHSAHAENRSTSVSTTTSKTQPRLSNKSKANRNRQTSRKSSLHPYIFSNDVNLPTWECISPNIDQILSDKHTKSGVYSHEIHLIQQELEALLSMSTVRESLLQSTDIDSIKSKICQLHQAEQVYSSKVTPHKPLLLPLINHHQQQKQTGPHLLLDRQVSIAPVTDTRVDKIWSDINNFFNTTPSNDIVAIRKHIEFNQQLEEQIQKYRNNKLSRMSIATSLKNENYQDFLNLNNANLLINHYTNRTSILRFQTKFYESIIRTTSRYKSPILKQFDVTLLNHYLNSHSFLSEDLQKFKTIGDDEHSLVHEYKERPQPSSIHSTLPEDFQERFQLVHYYLTDEHPFEPGDRTSKKKQRISTDVRPDLLATKLSTLISLLHECSSIGLYALKRADAQSNIQQTWQKLTAIEHDLELLIERISSTGDDDHDGNSTSMKKSFQTLDRLLKDWDKHELAFAHQCEQLFNVNV